MPFYLMSTNIGLRARTLTIARDSFQTRDEAEQARRDSLDFIKNWGEKHGEIVPEIELIVVEAEDMSAAERQAWGNVFRKQVSEESNAGKPVGEE